MSDRKRTYDFVRWLSDDALWLEVFNRDKANRERQQREGTDPVLLPPIREIYHGIKSGEPFEPEEIERLEIAADNMTEEQRAFVEEHKEKFWSIPKTFYLADWISDQALYYWAVEDLLALAEEGEDKDLSSISDLIEVAKWIVDYGWSQPNRALIMEVLSSDDLTRDDVTAVSDFVSSYYRCGGNVQDRFHEKATSKEEAAANRERRFKENKEEFCLTEEGTPYEPTSEEEAEAPDLAA